VDTVTHTPPEQPAPTGHPAIDYAQIQLGVHTVFDEANTLDALLNDHLTALDKAQDERRNLDLAIEDREMDLLIEERGKHADMSEAAMDRHLRMVRHGDADLKKLKLQRNAKAGECSGIELDIEYTKSRLRTMTARMTELGGYFQYLAACKLAEKTP
jgi:hypothetical protein